MAREKKDQYVVITPKNKSGEKRLSYHGTKWIFRRQTDTPPASYAKAGEGVWILAMSTDGKTILWIKKQDDPDFDVRMLG
jgi:hypothetical protein